MFRFVARSAGWALPLFALHHGIAKGALFLGTGVAKTSGRSRRLAAVASWLSRASACMRGAQDRVGREHVRGCAFVAIVAAPKLLLR